MINVNDFCDRAKYIALNRQSFYNNSFPFNSMYIHQNGVLSADCIGFIKGMINNPDIYNKYEPVGYYCPIGKNIGDIGEREIYNQCTEKSSDFRKLYKGAYLEMDMIVGHAGLFVDEFVDNSGVCNVIECTTDFGGGITTSYVNEYGQRYNHKNGEYSGLNWERFGKLSKWINYNNAEKIDVDGECGKDTITLFQTIAKKDYPEIIIDGKFSGQNKILCDTYFPSYYKEGFTFTGEGSISISVIQKICKKYYLGSITGIFDFNTAGALQDFLKSFGYATTDKYGYFGNDSCKQWQKFLNSLV